MKYYINPNIVFEEGAQWFMEVCISISGFIGKVTRPYRIKIEYIDESGNKKQEIKEGLPAIVLAHEIDHLNGKLYIDKVEDELIPYRSEEEKKLLRQQYPHTIISKN